MTELSEAIHVLKNKGLSYRQISQELGCSKSTVNYWCTPGVRDKNRIDRKNLASIEQHPCNGSGCTQLTTNPKYCSVSCYRSATSRNKETTCIDCKETGKVARKRCSSCRQKWVEKKHQKKIEEWLSGKWEGGKDLSPIIRNYLIIKANYTCQSSECVVSGGCRVFHPVTGNPVLNIDHIDGNSENQHPDNLRVLCPTCHAMTENYGSLNIGKSARTTRRVEFLKNKYTLGGVR